MFSLHARGALKSLHHPRRRVLVCLDRVEYVLAADSGLPRDNLDPFSGLQILVVLEKMLNLREPLGAMSDHFKQCRYHGRILSIGTASSFESPRFIFHLQHTERPAAHDYSRL